MACQWKNSSAEMISYHDKEWGVPTHDDQKLFEYLLLESMQAGLSWALILRKRETLRSCFANFSPEKLATFTEEDIERIMHTENMIRSERKIRAMIQNAKAFLALQKEEGSFDAYLWSFSGGKSLCYQGHEKGNMPSKNALSEAISKDLKKRGFQYTGPVIVYSFLQACGVINDHEADCPCYRALRKAYPYQEVEETFIMRPHPSHFTELYQIHYHSSLGS